MATTPPIETHPLTPARWGDFADLMGLRFDTRHCWCMWPRLATNYQLRTGEANRRSMKRIVDTASAPPGVLAYIDGVPVGWCAIAPRAQFPKLDRSRATAPVDTQAAWSVVCFNIRRDMRRMGLSQRLLEAAVALAAEYGATLVEAYPVEETRNLFRGVTSVFKRAGFVEVARRSPHRPIMRYEVPKARVRRRAAKSSGPTTRPAGRRASATRGAR